MPKTPTSPLARLAGALAFIVTLVLTGAHAHESSSESDTRGGVVFHIDSDEHMNRSLRQISRHREAHPDIPLRVILIAGGVRPALVDAKDPNGGLYSAQLEQLLAQGVRIFACENTLLSFNLSTDDLTFGIETVHSGVAELGRLQSEDGFAYIKL